MEQPESQGQPRPRSRQLALPLAAPGHHPPPLPVATLSTRQVWASLGADGQGRLRQLLIRVVREVVREQSA